MPRAACCVLPVEIFVVVVLVVALRQLVQIFFLFVQIGFDGALLRRSLSAGSEIRMRRKASVGGLWIPSDGCCPRCSSSTDVLPSSTTS